MAVVGTIINVVVWVLYVFILFLIARAVVSWVQLFAPHWTPRGPVLVVVEAIYTVTDPFLRRLRRIMPPVGLRGTRIDISMFVLMIMTYVAIGVIGLVYRLAAVAVSS